MRNVCVVIKKRVSVEEGGESAVIRQFDACGYSFAEIRILSQADGQAIRSTLGELKKEYENILLLCDRTALPIVRGYSVAVFSENSQVASFANAGIFTDKNTSLFLLSADEMDTGIGFVKNVCVNYLQQKYGARFEKITVKSVGAGIDRLQALLAEADRIGEGKLRVFHSRKYDEDTVDIVYDGATPKMLVDEVLRLLVESLGDTVYALNEVSLEEQLLSIAKIRGKRISVAESFTGGGIAKRITSVSGASEVYFEGVNTYNEVSKVKRLGVSEYGLRTAGAVSDQTAYEMALGLLNTGDCDIAIATTGLAGPKSDRSMLPVGLCYIAVGTKEKILVYRYKFDGNRKEITEKAINYAMFLAYRELKNI